MSAMRPGATPPTSPTRRVSWRWTRRRSWARSSRASLEQASAAEHPSLEGGEEDELDEDADEQDHEHRREHAADVGELAALLQHRPESEADRAADGDDLGGHERAPRERPALLQ